MAKIIPFKAVRPTRDKVNLIACRSYETYTKAEREARMEVNPFSFLHILDPGFKYHQEISGIRRYTLVKNRFQEFKEDNIFLQEEKPSLYFYKIINRDGHEFNGVIAGASTWDYRNNIIKKHESTIARREEIFEQYLKTVGFNAESVLITHPDNEELKSIISSIMKDRAEYEFTTTYRDTHYIWNVDDAHIIKKVTAIFKSMNALYIADGHHRCASSCLLAKNAKESNPNHTGNEPYNFFMTYLIPESDLKIYEFNRLVKDLNGLSKEEFLLQLDSVFRIEARGQEYYKPSKKHHFSMYLDGEFYSLYLRKAKYQIQDALEALDVHILYDTVLKPILGIEDVRVDQRLHYSHGKNDLAYVKTLVDSGEFSVGFGLLPITIQELKNVANENLVMPPKSTFIEPKLRSGIVIYEF
ncbi:MAG: DUF1015 domain-containing protein [Flavobacteriales bacterium]